jgi:prepilin-type N-terminal cleavage/methylation domain-containing protein
MISNQRGMTLLEMLVVLIIAGILTTLGAYSARHLWLVRSLDGSKNQIVTQLRRQQQRVIAETHPLVYGARFPRGGDRDRFFLVRFDANNLMTTTDDTCTQYQEIELGTGVRVVNDSVSFDDSDDIVPFCKTRLVDSNGASVAGESNDRFAFFYARGNATEGFVTIEQETLGREELVCVLGLTGRVYEEVEDGSCP